MDLFPSASQHTSGERMANKTKMLFSVLASAALLGILIIGLMRMTSAASSFGGVDFFYYICTSRDQVLGITNLNASRYFYFPGVYVVWSALMRTVEFDLRYLQLAYLLAIVANTVLTGALVFLVTRALWCGMFASTLYLFTTAYTEGAEGCTEVFCTLPFLSGLLTWAVMIKGGKKIGAMVALGILGAATLFMKQQAGLLLVGGIALLPLTLRSDGKTQIKLPHLILAGLVFLIALGVFFVAEGGGLSALRFGLQGIGGYDDHNSFYENVSNLKPFMPLLGLVCAGAILWTVSLFRIKSLNNHEAIFFSILGMCLIGGISSMYQFKTRGYLHYALLTAPSLAVVCSLGLFLALHQLTSPKKFPGRVLGIFLVFLCCWPLFIGWEKTAPLRNSIESLETRSTTDEIMAPFSQLCEFVPSGTEFFLFPPRRNIIHWYCKTKSTVWVGGYGWGEPDLKEYERALSTPSLKHVFVLREDSVDYNTPAAISLRGAPITRELAAKGFNATLNLDAGTLFTR
jgi:hypothetical protein